MPESAIRRIWLGHAPLPITFWLWGVGGNMSLLALLVAMSLAGASDPLLWAVWVLGVLWHGFVWVAIWRAGRHYPGPRIWPLLSRIGLFLGIIRLSVEAAVLSGVT